MRETVKKFFIQETELCILLALKSVKALYGICLDSTETMTQEELCYNLFNMQKKGIIDRRADADVFCIEEELDSCIERIRTAARFIVLADADELVPERYFYVAREGAVILEAAGQYDTGNAGAFHLEAVTEAVMWDRIRESGFVMETANGSVPAEVLERAQGCWQEDKDTILRHATVEKLLQEYDVHTHCKIKQCIRMSCGLDTYLVCSGGVNIEGGEKS